jgi:hypothetical protein
MIIRYSINKRNPVPIVILKKKKKTGGGGLFINRIMQANKCRRNDRTRKALFCEHQVITGLNKDSH